ncbi:hypothetical protein HELRODRAFT_172619 [Helobdella robusta]|uniref:Uncharacterized protein n=1 Tax=Helobdella robusta TaxID=6412 RepID=T1F5N1_HELRO|nr:hypothetical protein HELRODRAFT_172619 [Helobdella robusta]ESO04262.1 hypothetical protein HELRODRAFT_172619 [Helobdella robusta]
MLRSSDPPFISPFIKFLLCQKNKLMRLGSTLKAAAITKYINKLIINFNSKTFTNSKRESEAMWEQVNKIRGSEKSLNTSTVQHIDANTLNAHFASMSTDQSYKIPPTKATAINSHQHQQFTPYSVLHMLTKACPSGTEASNYSTSLIISRIKYAAPSWSGFATQQQLQQLQSLIKKLIRCNYLPASYPTITQIFNTLDSRLFKKIENNNNHRKHKYQVAAQSTYQEKTFITRHLKNIST